MEPVSGDGADVGGSRVGVLTTEECMGLLATEQVGRLAVVVGHYPQVFPVNYRLDDFVVVFRTHVGTPLAEAHHRNVGFEVDHVDPGARTGWSVLIQGMAEDIADRPADTVKSRSEHLDIDSWAGGNQDRLVRIIPAHVSGRWIRPEDMGWAEDDRGYL